MKKAISLNLKTWVILSLSFIVSGTFIGCQEEVDQSNRFTFTGEVISTYLENNPEKYSHFVDILSKATIGKNSKGTMLKTLSTYGAYTCFAPVNEAVEAYVLEEYTKFKESYDKNQEDSSFPIVYTGIESPKVSDLSVEKCTEIARNHIIEDEYKSKDFVNNSPLAKKSMNFRDIKTHEDIINNERVYFVTDDSTEILDLDIDTYNGTVHSLKGVISPSTDLVVDEIEKLDGISIFRDALNKTGLNNLLAKYDIDDDYDPEIAGPQFGTRDDGLSQYPPRKKRGFTLLIEPNDVLTNPANNEFNMNIYDWKTLAEYAELVYGSEEGYEEEYTHPKNALFKYISYHILDRAIRGNVKDGPGGWIMCNYSATYTREYQYPFVASENMDPQYDWHDYFETYLPYDEWTYSDEELEAIREGEIEEGCMIKITRTTESAKKNDNKTIYLNHTRTPSAEMEKHSNILVMDEAAARAKYPTMTSAGKILNPVNAYIYYVDKILIYNEKEMTGNIINERMRWDAISLFPELTTNEVRWNTDDLFTFIPSGGNSDVKYKQFCKRLRINNSSPGDNGSEAYYMRCHPSATNGYVNYQGDEFLIEGVFDAEFRLPHVPAGTYEIRIGFSVSSRRGVIQFYLDGEVCGVPTDMRNNSANINRIGWFDESELTAEDIASNERAMRARGYMKAPASMRVGSESEGNKLVSMRTSNYAMRRIIKTNVDLKPTKEGHWIRVKNVTDIQPDQKEYNMDYVEIVPNSIYDNPTTPEDRN